MYEFKLDLQFKTLPVCDDKYGIINAMAVLEVHYMVWAQLNVCKSVFLTFL